ncbi:hypothetical protein HHI36_005451 [Cryptolaemus montrouzieri]|uniref:Uncharacterized protein n=1 Tax=Cryptolaemus montrouzieri TaxID=559131 RepID=A0ABD2NVR0_9CUCU
MFLVEQETPRESISSLDTTIKNIVETEIFNPDDTLMSPPLFSEGTHEEPVMASSSHSASSSFKSGTKRKRDKADEPSEKVSKTLDNKDDKFDIIGKNYAKKLRDMPFYERSSQMQ